METDFEYDEENENPHLQEFRDEQFRDFHRMVQAPKDKDITIRIPTVLLKGIEFALENSRSKDKKPEFIRKAIAEKILSIEIAQRIKDSLSEDINSMRFMKRSMDANFKSQNEAVHSTINTMAQQMDDRNRALTQMLEKQADENKVFLAQLMEVFESLMGDKEGGRDEGAEEEVEETSKSKQSPSIGMTR